MATTKNLKRLLPSPLGKHNFPWSPRPYTSELQLSEHALVILVSTRCSVWVLSQWWNLVTWSLDGRAEKRQGSQTRYQLQQGSWKKTTRQLNIQYTTWVLLQKKNDRSSPAIPERSLSRQLITWNYEAQYNICACIEVLELFIPEKSNNEWHQAHRN